MKKLFSLILICILITTQFAFGAVNSNYEVSGSIESDGSINPGDIFIYKITVKNVSGVDLTGIKAKFSGDFETVSGSDATIGNLTNTSEVTVSVPMKYTGSDDHLNVYVYNDTSAYTIVDNITIGNVNKPNTSTPSEPVNKDQYYADFKLNIDGIPRFYAGNKSTFSIDLTNITTYQAKDVQIELVNNGELFPFDDQLNKVISEKYVFSSKENKTVEIDVDTRNNAKNGFVDLPFKITYKNIYGIEKTITKTLQVEVVNKNLAPSVVLNGIRVSDDVLVPGQEHVIQLTLENLGSLSIKNMTASLEGLSMKGIQLNADTPNKQVSLIRAKDKTFILYDIKISEDLKEDKHELTLKLNYYDEYGTKYEEILPVYLDVQQTNNMDDLSIDITSSQITVHPEDSFKITFNVTNNSKFDQKNIELGIMNAPFINKSDSKIYINALTPGETKSFEFVLIVDKQTASNNYPLYITMEKNDVITEKYVGVYVDSESQQNSKPKIIVDSYSFGKDVILAGETFDLEITFFNTSNTMGIQNAKVSLSSDEGAFVPVNASSSFYIESIGIKEKVTHTITMKAKSDLSVKTFNVTADIEYEDSNGNSYDKNNNPYMATEHMAIPVMQELRLEIENISIGEMGFAFQPMELFVEFFNMGKSPLQNMMVKTEGDFEIQDGKYFVGNFSPGSNDYYSCTIIPMNVGSNEGKVIFEYEDAIGEKHVVEKTFVFEAMEMQTDFEEMDPNFGGGDMIPFEEEQKKGFPIIPVIVASIILIVVVVVIRKRIQKKKELALDE